LKQTELDWLINESKTTIDQMAVHLCFWLETHFVEKLGPGYWGTIKSTLGKTEDERRNLFKWNKITDLDLSVLLKITFRNLVYIKGDSHSFKKIIPEMQRVRNEIIGHLRIRGITFKLLAGYLNSTLIFSQLIDSPDYIQQRIKDIKERAAQFDLADQGKTDYPGIKTKPNKGLAPRKMTAFQPSQNIIEIFQGYDLTTSQSLALNSLKNFLENSVEQCFILNGYAGTGKTFMIGGIIKYLTAIKQDY
jgi:hypothetical protein